MLGSPDFVANQFGVQFTQSFEAQAAPNNTQSLQYAAIVLQESSADLKSLAVSLMLGVRGNKSEGDPGRVVSSESSEVKRKALRLTCEDVLDTSAELKDSSAMLEMAAANNHASKFRNVARHRSEWLRRALTNVSCTF